MVQIKSQGQGPDSQGQQHWEAAEIVATLVVKKRT